MPDDREARTILIADDHGDTRRVVRWMPEQKGYAVIEAADGQQVILQGRTVADTQSSRKSCG